MASLTESKNKINGQIASVKTLVLNSKKKFNAVNGKSENVIDSLLNIYKQLGGYKEMVETIEDVLVKRVGDIEQIIKSTIKVALKQIISCGVEPTIGDNMTITGVTFTIKNVDPLSLFTIDPTSENGQLVYFDNLTGIHSTDFNVFLYNEIKTSVANPLSAGSTWNSMLKVKFKENDTITNQSNTLTITIDNSYHGKKLSAFISDYLDSVKLFNNTQLLSSIFDDIMGSKIYSIKKTRDQIAAEKIINKLVDDILNNVDETDVLDDSFYQFSNDSYNQILEESEDKRKGVFKYNGEEQNDLAVDETTLMNDLLTLKNTPSTKITDQTTIIKNTINSISDDIVNKSNVSEKDKFALKLNFITNIISKLMSSITLTIFSPKIIFLFVMTTKLLDTTMPNGVIDFIKKNINIYKIIIVKIRDIITNEITKKIKQMLTPLLTQVGVILVKEKMAIYKKQMDLITAALSLIF